MLFEPGNTFGMDSRLRIASTPECLLVKFAGPVPVGFGERLRPLVAAGWKESDGCWVLPRRAATWDCLRHGFPPASDASAAEAPLSGATDGAVGEDPRAETPPIHPVGKVRVTRGRPGTLHIRFPYVAHWAARIRTVPGRVFDESRLVWIVPDSLNSIECLRRAFQGEPLEFDLGDLPGPRDAEVESTRVADTIEAVAAEASAAPPEARASIADLVCRLDQQLRLRQYSPKTRKAYCFHVRAFSRFFRRDLAEADEPDIQRYLLYLINDAKVSTPHINQAISALKFLYIRVLRRPVAIAEIPRPKGYQSLPVVLSRDEVLRIFGAIPNIKHRTLLMLAYAAGLRVSEVVNLRPEDIDEARGMIRIRQGKGRKDRYSTLSEVALETLREYRKWVKPSEWLFPGGREGTPLTVRSVEKVIATGAAKARVGKRVTPHTLRHSFATHLLEDGIDLRHVQELLGHRRPETTMRYTRVTRKDLRRIRSPLDTIYKNLAEGDVDADMKDTAAKLELRRFREDMASGQGKGQTKRAKRFRVIRWWSK